MINNKFDNNILNFKELTKKAFSNFKDVNPLFKDYKVRVINSMQNNIASLLVNNFKFPIRKLFKYIPCNVSNCNTCFYSNKQNNIFLTGHFCLPILNDSDYFSVDLIYLIYCKFCNFF